MALLLPVRRQAWEAVVPAVVTLLMIASSQHSAATQPEAALPIGLPNCTTTCGDVQVPYPFGLGPPRCYLPGFNLSCDRSGRRPRLLLAAGDTNRRVVNISVANSTVRVVRDGAAATWTALNIAPSTNEAAAAAAGIISNLPAQYKLSTDNELVLVGCNVQATLLGAKTAGSNATEEIGACTSFCNSLDTARFQGEDIKSCIGILCCQAGITSTSVPKELRYSHLKLNYSQEEENPVLAFVAEVGWFDQELVAYNITGGMDYWRTTAASLVEAPISLRWAVPLPPGDMTDVSKDENAPPLCSKERARRLCKSGLSNCVDVLGGSSCYCRRGYEGNPYIADGCRDINECDHPEDNGCFGKCTNIDGGFHCGCPVGTNGNHNHPNGCRPITGITIGLGVSSGAGFVILVLITLVTIWMFKRRRIVKLKQKYFKQNRGQLLQQLVSQRADIAESMIIPVDELIKATNNFDKARELGGGGHGTVYKGILSNLHVVAIKKSNITVQKEIDEFINEVAILSQINHRNVVKLVGCCLETEVPLLVYEFISNGTLYHHLHVEGPISLSWATRLRIATEIATALAYLHSAISIPVIHRDIKSTNILVDDTLTSMVSDFGASRYIPVEKTGLTTGVQGTIGYLDPSYFYTGRLTDKSDVYSFGVILVELLTRKKPYAYLSPNGDGLVSHFVNLHAEGNLAEILDSQVMEEGGEEVQQAAILATSCIKLRGEDRPSMRQVELALEGLQASSKQGQNNMDRSVISCPSIKVGQSAEHLSRRYSLEQEFFMSARYPR